MIRLGAHLFRWGPIPARLLWINQWRPIFRSRQKYYPRPWPETLLLFRGRQVLFLCDNDALELRGFQVFKGCIQPVQARREIYQQWKTTVRRLFDFAKVLSSTRVRSFSSADLLRAWRRLHEFTDAFWRTGIIPELAAYGAAPELVRRLEAEGLTHKQVQQYAAALSAPEQSSFYRQEEQALLKLYRLPKAERFGALRGHAEEYAWIANSYAGADETAGKAFQTRFQERRRDWKMRLRQLEAHPDLIRVAKQKLFRTLRGRRSLRSFANALSFAIAWQDERKGMIFRYLTFVDRVAREIARRNRLPLRTLSFALSAELNTKPRPRLVQSLRQRARAPFSVLMNRRGIFVMTGQQARRLDEKLWQLKPAEQITELRGIVTHAGQGVVTGNVFVVRTHRDLERFPRGAVLVTTMTAPEYVVAMRRARAVVTDTSGLTSHAAIVSRELNLPCIVGTKYATQVLKTGDRVRIDGRRGVVGKVKSQKTK